MNPDTLIAVSGYTGDQHQIQNNLPLYLHHECPVLILSPSNAAITSVSNPAVHCQWFGESGWIGKHTLARHVLFLQALLRFPQQHFLFHDADSICLSPKIPQYLYDASDVIWSNEVVDTNPGPSLLPKIAMQPPYFLSRRNISGMLNCLSNLPTSYYGPPINPDGWPLPFPTECIDHFILQLASGSGFEHRSYHDGASFETASHSGLETMSELVRNHGYILLHSVKTLTALDRLRVEHEVFCRTH